MALPLGKKSLAQIERRIEPLRRVADLATLLEWRIQSGARPSQSGLRPLAELLADQTAAIGIRDRVVHLVPRNIPVSPAEAETAAQALRDAVITLGGDDILRDPFDELSAPDAGKTLDPRMRLAQGLWRLDAVHGYRVAFSDDPGTLEKDLEIRLARHHSVFRNLSYAEVRDSWVRPSWWQGTVKDAAREVEDAVDAVLRFDAGWRVDAGALPLQAIRLEPDRCSRVRLLSTLLEHVLAWLPGSNTKTSREPLRNLVEKQNALFSQPEQVRDAIEVRDRLVRTMPDGVPAASGDVDRAERCLWRAIYELRPHCDWQHAWRFTFWPAKGLPARSFEEVRSWKNPAARLIGMRDAVAQMVDGHEAESPGEWAIPFEPHRHSLTVESLARWDTLAADNASIAWAIQYMDRLEGAIATTSLHELPQAEKLFIRIADEVRRPPNAVYQWATVIKKEEEEEGGDDEEGEKEPVSPPVAPPPAPPRPPSPKPPPEPPVPKPQPPPPPRPSAAQPPSPPRPPAPPPPRAPEPDVKKNWRERLLDFLK